MTTITLTVTSFNGQPGDGSLSAQFDELGGLIGRADTNQFVLPDPDRSISRVHAQVVFRNNRYAIIDRGSNPILVNGQAAGNDREMPLRDGDVVQIGGYELMAKLVDGAAAKAASSDPFADLLGAPPAKPSGGGSAALIDPLAAFGAPAQPPRAPAPSAFARPPAPAATGGIPDDWNPFAPDAGSAPARPGSGFGAPAGGGRSGGLGLDLGAAAPAPLIPELSGGGGGGGDSLDSLFGLKASSGADPFAQSALGQAAAQPNMAAHADPLKSLSSAAQATSETVTDNVSDLNRPFMSAPLLAPTPAPRPAGPPPAPDRSGMAAPAGMSRPGTTAPGMAGGAVLSWDSEPSGSHTVIRPGGLRDDPAASITRGPLSPARGDAPLSPLPAGPLGGPLGSPIGGPIGDPLGGPIGTDLDPFAALSPASAAQAPLDAAALFGSPTPTPPVAPMPVQPQLAPRSSITAPVAQPAMPSMASIMAPATAPAQRAAMPAATTTQAVAGDSSADVQALFEAFKEGLGDPELKFNTLTPDLMRLVGGLLYEASSGTVDMLVARAALKRELRAESTMIKARENNPLKFSPTAEVALQHLLSPPARGFMAAAPAMRDAYTDLRAHQFGMVAGMRAALEGVLDRFDPAELEGRLTQRSVLHSLMPGSRKARLWEVFVEHFSQIREEASEDFQNLFGAAFLQAYNDHIDQIDREGK